LQHWLFNQYKKMGPTVGGILCIFQLHFKKRINKIKKDAGTSTEDIMMNHDKCHGVHGKIPFLPVFLMAAILTTSTSRGQTAGSSSQAPELWEYSTPSSSRQYRVLSKADLTDKINGYWIGQLAGNYVGFPFENLYSDNPIPVFIDRYFNFRDADSLGLKMNTGDRRAYVDIIADTMGGAWSDDDTDIEFVTLHAIEKYGLDLYYEEMAGMRKEHVRRFIWSSNARVRDLIDEGYLPPETGSRELNDYWYRISSQLINEIWGAVYPGMTDKAAERAEWGARITNDSWATHGTRAIVAMYSAAFFEKDPYKLVEIGMSKLPGDSPYLEAFRDLVKWSRENEDWKATRQLIHDKYFREVDGFEIPYPMGGAVINGLNGVMALLYGEGDFTRTVGIATTSGYDCDNQAATMGGLTGIINGGSAIPDKFTRELPSRGSWERPFNDTYINYSRDKLPNYNRISEIVERLVAIAEQAIIENGGDISHENGEVIYHVRTDF
jgi:ADP-ribosylglycohydrolase